jgi:hypothetical protein
VLDGYEVMSHASPVGDHSNRIWRTNASRTGMQLSTLLDVIE